MNRGHAPKYFDIKIEKISNHDVTVIMVSCLVQEMKTREAKTENCLSISQILDEI